VAQVAVPLHRGGVVVGCLVLLLPASLTAPTKAELTAWSALGAHASVALADERLREQAATHAAELERHRLGRDLHDSVIAALFSLTTRAQAVRRGWTPGTSRSSGRRLRTSRSCEAGRSRSCGRWSPTCAVRAVVGR
jgi:signal transduction histidine kinase